MARSVIRPDESEVEFFHANYCYMWKKLNTAPYYVCGYGQEPDWINASWLLPSYVNLSKCLNPTFVPSMNLVNKIVQFYNANISPTVDTYAFLHEYLEKSDDKRGLGDSGKLNELCGLYYGYYFAGIEEEAHIYGSIIKIYQDGSAVSASMIAGLTDNEVMSDPKMRKLFDKNKLDLDAYKEYKKSLPLAKRRTSLYKGPVTYTPGLLSLSLKDEVHESNYIHVRIPVGKEVDDRYLGSLGIITMVSEDFNIQLLKIGIERADDTELSELKLNDDKLPGLLSIKKAANEHIYLSAIDNVRWTDYLLSSAT